MPTTSYLQALLCLYLLLLPCRVARAQEVPVYHAETHLIDTTISVHDSRGALVPDLTRDDISVVEDGVPQTIRFFSHAQQLPLSIGLILDVSGSQEKFIKAHQRDMTEFLRLVLTPDDRAFALCFGNHLRLVSDWSNDRDAIESNLSAFNHGHNDQPELGPKEERDLGTALFDAVYFSIAERLAGLTQRRKVLIVFSDGEENSSEHDLLDSIAAAQNADVLVYAIRYTDAKPGKMSARDRYGVRVLDHLTAQTGGKSYDASSMQVGQAFAEIAGELRSLYSVAYQSTNHLRDGAFRKIVFTSRRPEIVLRGRGGYYAR